MIMLATFVACSQPEVKPTKVKPKERNERRDRDDKRSDRERHREYLCVVQ